MTGYMKLNFLALFFVTIFLIVGAAEVGAWLGRRSNVSNETDISTLTGAALGLLALLLGFSFSLATQRRAFRRSCFKTAHEREPRAGSCHLTSELPRMLNMKRGSVA